MSPAYEIFGLIVLVALAAEIVRFAYAPRPWRRKGAHPGPTSSLPSRAPRASAPIAASQSRRAPRAYGAARPDRQPSIFLTPRQLERVNIHRKLRGRNPLNRAGFAHAAAYAAGQSRQPSSINDWLTYLILFECLDEHSASRVFVDTGLTITPEAPFNGHGGDFAGAGASGRWESPDATLITTAADIAAEVSTESFDSGSSSFGS